MKVTVEQLRETSRALLDHVERLGVNEIDLEVDYYWHIPRFQVYDVELEKLQPDLGQLSEDWQKLESIRRGEEPPIAIALEWLGAVYRAVGERVVG